MDDYRQFLDFEGLKEYDTLIKRYIDSGSIADLKEIIGDLEIKAEETAKAIENLRTYVEEQYNSIQSVETSSIDTLFNEEENKNG